MMVKDAMEIIKKREEEMEQLQAALANTSEPNDEVFIPRSMALYLFKCMKVEIDKLLYTRVGEDDE